MDNTVFETQFNEILAAVKEAVAIQDFEERVKAIYGKFHTGFCPYIQFIRLDGLRKEDWPHNIDRNSLYVEFELNLANGKISMFSGGHVYLNEHDRNTEQYKYLAMRGMSDIATDYGVKKFRKQNIKSPADVAEKMVKYFIALMESVQTYTGQEYPYKN